MSLCVQPVAVPPHLLPLVLLTSDPTLSICPSQGTSVCPLLGAQAGAGPFSSPFPSTPGMLLLGAGDCKPSRGPLETRGTPKMSRKNGTVKAASASPGFTFFCICCNVLDEPALFCSQQETVNVIFKN